MKYHAGVMEVEKLGTRAKKPVQAELTPVFLAWSNFPSTDASPSKGYPPISLGFPDISPVSSPG